MASRGIPMDQVPADAEPISEEQFERLPVYVHEYMAQSLAGAIPTTTPQELAEIHAQYFTPRVEEVMQVDDEASCLGKRPIESVSNSPSDMLEKIMQEDA